MNRSTPPQKVVLSPLRALVLIGCMAAAGPAGCGDDASSDTSSGSTSSPSSSSSSASSGDDAACNGPTPLLSMRDVALDDDHPCHDWVDIVRGRVAHNSGASMALWSLRTDFGAGLFVSANHVLGQDWYAPGGQRVERRMELVGESGILRLRLPHASGDLDGPLVLSPMYEFFNPDIPAEQTANALRDIRPRHDFYVAVIDGQTIAADDGPGGGAAGPVTGTPPALFDPNDAALADQTWSEPAPDDDVLLAGYPAVEFPEDGGFSVGVVLSDAQAEEAIVWLAQQGDEEGGIAYDPEAEFLVLGPARTGMSGGGAFDREGRLLGVLVRATEAREDGIEYTRVVRMSWIVADLAEAYAALEGDARTSAERFVGLELQ